LIKPLLFLINPFANCEGVEAKTLLKIKLKNKELLPQAVEYRFKEVGLIFFLISFFFNIFNFELISLVGEKKTPNLTILLCLNLLLYRSFKQDLKLNILFFLIPGTFQ